jgi:heme A synthase
MARAGSASRAPFVVGQHLLGGITVLLHLAPAVSTAHAGLAEVFFSMTVGIALFTSSGWSADTPSVDYQHMLHPATATTVVSYTKILDGATMRHTAAGLAIPDFP